MHLFKVIVGMAAMLAACAVFAQTGQNPVGTWHTISDVDGKPRGIVEITEENGVLSGKISGTLRPDESLDKLCDVCPGDKKGKKLLGMTILSGLKRSGDEWTGGEIMDPDTGKVYRAKVWLEEGGKKLKVRGYIGVSLLGRSQQWSRAQ
jgi:uncharacterized protein (DUF2147 family)